MLSSYLFPEHSAKEKAKEKSTEEREKVKEGEKEKKKHKVMNEIKRENGEVKQPLKGRCPSIIDDQSNINRGDEMDLWILT